MLEPEKYQPPGRLPLTLATENTLYEAATEITSVYPFFGLGLSTYVDETSQFVVRIGGPVVATVSATLAAVAALRSSLEHDADNPFGVAALRQFPKCVKRLLSGVPCMDAVEPLMKQERQMFETRTDIDSILDLGPAMPAVYGPYPVPMMVQALIGVLQGGVDLSRFGDEFPFTAAFAMSDEYGESWAAYVGGWPSHAVTAVITLLNAVQEFLDDGLKEHPELSLLKENLLAMVREAWKTKEITGLVEDIVLGNER